MGDLNPTNPFYFKKAGAGAFAKYNFNPTWAIRFGYNYTPLAANDKNSNSAYQQKRNLSFENRVSELSLLTEFNFFKYSTNRYNTYTPYLIGGVGLIKNNPFVHYLDSKVHLRKLLLEEDKNNNSIRYSLLALVIPLGIGFKYNLKKDWTIAAEANYRIAVTDYLDNVSGYYPTSVPTEKVSTNTQIRNEDGTLRPFQYEDWIYLTDPSGEYSKNKGTLRGDSQKLDGYLTAGLTLTYTFRSKKCAW